MASPTSLAARQRNPLEPPFYTIDLSLPPRARHNQICQDYAEQIKELATLYDEVLALTPFPRALKYFAKRLLRRVYSPEENEELRGIVQATGIDKHLVIAYNTFLDLFSGCMSGGTKMKGEGHGKARMVHFRNLDWEMEPLRAMIIGVEYVREGVVVARAVSYAGYLGTLTGVREGLSISLNYRAGLSSPFSAVARRYHQALLLMGLRPSVSSHLRRILLAPGSPPTLSELSQTLPKTPSAPCYLIFCSPESALYMEKDLRSAVLGTSDEFIAVTNHDRHMESWSDNRWKAYLKEVGTSGGVVRDVVVDSIDRKECLLNMKQTTRGAPSLATLRSWLETKPVTNECTHFSCIMDPSAEGGGLLWIRAYESPVETEDSSSSSYSLMSSSS